MVSYVTADQVALGADTSLCQGNSLTLAANVPNPAYQWRNGSTAASIIVNNRGQYNVKVATNGCTATDTINVLFNAIPYFFLGTDTAYGLNDFFKVSPGEPTINFKLVIYNRYGQLLFQDTNKQHG